MPYSPYSFGSAKRLNWSIVTRAHAPRQDIVLAHDPVFNLAIPVRRVS
jgi:hypothetical protein